MQYEIKGGSLPVVECTLAPNETIITEKGGMAWMTNNMKMDTKAGGLGKAIGRMFAGEAAFQNRYTAQGGEGMIAFASSFPGSILAVNITPDKPVICQKKAFLACESGVDLSIHLQRKIGAGFFGGEGFIMQKLSGDGIAFIEIDGAAITYELAAGEKMVFSTGYVAMMDTTCTMSIETVPGLKNKLLGGEGLFNTTITGPGKVIVQSMPLSQLIALFPQPNK